MKGKDIVWGCSGTGCCEDYSDLRRTM